MPDRSGKGTNMIAMSVCVLYVYIYSQTQNLRSSACTTTNWLNPVESVHLVGQTIRTYQNVSHSYHTKQKNEQEQEREQH